MAKNSLAAVLEKIDGYRDAVIHLQTELCRRPALDPTSDGIGEAEKAAYLQSYLENMGLEVARYDSRDDRVPSGIRPNLVAVLAGGRSAPRLSLISHTDVVPPGDPKLWSGDPWTLRVEGDKIVGRGVEDNQGGLVASVMAAKAFLESHVAPEVPIFLGFVADEETGSAYGLRFLIERHRDLFRKDDLIVIPDSGNAKGTVIEVAEKGLLWIRFRTKGKQTHGSVPETGINAHKAAAYFTVRMDSLYGKFKRRDPLFDPPNSTFEPTKKEANVPNVNTIPGEDVIYFDCRILPQYSFDKVLRAVKALVRETEKKFRVKIQMDLVQNEPAAPATDPKAPVAVAIAKAVKELRRRTPKTIGIGGGTVARYLRYAGFPCAVWATMDERAHRPDEYAFISHILSDAKVFAHMAMQGGEVPAGRARPQDRG